MRWRFWQRSTEKRALSVSDPRLAMYLGVGTPNYSAVDVTEESALSVSAVWRAVSLISSVAASLTLRTVATNPDGTTSVVPSWLDDPGGVVGLTPYEFIETTMLHELLYGNAYQVHIYTGGRAIAGLQPVHPAFVSTEIPVDPDRWIKSYTVATVQGPREYTDLNLLHIPGLSSDNVSGYSPLTIARNSFGLSIAGDRAAAKMFATGALNNGIASPAPGDEFAPGEVTQIQSLLTEKVTGWENASNVSVLNRPLNWSTISQSAADAQFLESRQFQVEEIARWFGVPPFELMQTEKQTSWGTGIEAQQRGLARQVLGPWTTRLEQRYTTLLPEGQRAEFDFSPLERPTPAEEVDILAAMVAGGIITPNEARQRRNLEPLDGGDQLYAPAGATATASSAQEVGI